MKMKKKKKKEKKKKDKSDVKKYVQSHQTLDNSKKGYKAAHFI